MHLDGFYSTMSSSRQKSPLFHSLKHIFISNSYSVQALCYSKALYASLVISNEVSLAKCCSGKVLSLSTDTFNKHH